MIKKFNQIILCLIASIFFEIGCSNTDNNYYVINKVKLVASLFQDSNLLSGSNILGTSSQQFPVRTGCSTTHFYLVTLSPTSEIPTLTINGIVLFALGNNYLSNGGGARGVQAGTTGPSVAASVFFNPTTPTTTSTIQTTPFRITVFDYTVNCASLTTAALTSYMNQIGDIPGFQLSYTVSSGISSDQGFYTFYFLPVPTDPWWSTTTFPSAVSASKVTQVKNGLAVTNNPIQISSLSPTGGTIAASWGSAIIGNITTPSIPSPRDTTNSIYSPSSRVQWYVSTGQLNLDTANSTTWNPASVANTSVGGFFVVRDLLGGVDFKVLGPFTTQ